LIFHTTDKILREEKHAQGTVVRMIAKNQLILQR
jgi:hypothetical protein